MTWSSKEFYDKYSKPGVEREVAVVREVLGGNIPSWLKLVPLEIGEQKFEVLSDYLSIGTDSDYVRVPLTPIAAQYLANHYGYKLPTPELVDAIYERAALQLTPHATDWYKHEEQMRYGPNYLLHSHMIDESLVSPQGLVAGHKKDVVATDLLHRYPESVAIYGWHLSSGRMIQPLFLGHDWHYEDYSHGVRFIKTDSDLAGPCCISKLPEEFLKAM